MTIASIVYVVLALVLVGLVLSVLPIDGKMKQLIYIVVAVAIVLWLLAIFLPGFNYLPRGR